MDEGLRPGDVLLIFEQARGRVASNGILSVIRTVGLVAGLTAYRRARCKRSDALPLDTVSLRCPHISVRFPASAGKRETLL
jgi:hypothetical protein